jgi:uncharacterized protein YxjI
VEGEFFSLGKQLHICDSAGTEIAQICEKLLSFMPRYYVYVGETQVAEIIREFTFFKPRYSIDGLNWDVTGDLWAHDYEVTENRTPIVTIHKEWMTWGDCYELDIADSANEIAALAVVLAIDATLEKND